MLSVYMLFVYMLFVYMLFVYMLSVYMLFVYMLFVYMLFVYMLFVYMLSVSWRASRGRHVSGVWLHRHGLSFYTRILSYSYKFLAFIKRRLCMALT